MEQLATMHNAAGHLMFTRGIAINVIIHVCVMSLTRLMAQLSAFSCCLVL
jgi:hypothetical protein